MSSPSRRNRFDILAPVAPTSLRRRRFYACCCALAILVLPSLATAQLSPETSCEDAIQGFGELPEKLKELATYYLGSERWPREDRERLCRGTRDPHQPPSCFANVMESEEPWDTGKTARWELAIDLCAGTNDAKETFKCFQANKSGGRPGEFTQVDRWLKAVKACSLQASAGSGGSTSAPIPTPGSDRGPGTIPTTGGAIDPQKEAMQKEIERLKKELAEKSKPKIVIPQELAEDVEALKKQTFQKAEPKFQQYGSLESGKISAPFQLSIDEDGTYSIVALCGKECKDVEIALHDENNNRLGGTPLGTKNKPVVGFKAREGSKFSVNLLMKSCSKSPCPFGILLLEEAADAVASVQLFNKAVVVPPVSSGSSSGSSGSGSTGTSGGGSTGSSGSGTTGSSGSGGGGTAGTPVVVKLPANECADLLEKHIDFDYTTPTWPTAGVEVREMCLGVPNAFEPPRCYYRMMHETGPPEGRSDWQADFARRLCAKTTNADARVDCFRQEVAKEKAYRPVRRKDRAQLAAGPARWSHAIGICMRRTEAAAPTKTLSASAAKDYIRPGFAEVDTCLKSIQGKVPFGFRGPTTWNPSTLEQLCRGTSKGKEPGDCFNLALSSGVRNPNFSADEAVELCAGTSSGATRVTCLKGESQAMSPTGSQSGLDSAIRKCAKD